MGDPTGLVDARFDALHDFVQMALHGVRSDAEFAYRDMRSSVERILREASSHPSTMYVGIAVGTAYHSELRCSLTVSSSVYWKSCISYGLS